VSDLPITTAVGSRGMAVLRNTQLKRRGWSIVPKLGVKDTESFRLMSWLKYGPAMIGLILGMLTLNFIILINNL
jgi:hypothetical protein